MVGCYTRFYCSTKHSNFMGMQYKDVQPQTQIFSFKWSAFSFILVTIVLFQWKIYFCFISLLIYNANFRMNWSGTKCLGLLGVEIHPGVSLVADDPVGEVLGGDGVAVQTDVLTAGGCGVAEDLIVHRVTAELLTSGTLGVLICVSPHVHKDLKRGRIKYI